MVAQAGVLQYDFGCRCDWTCGQTDCSGLVSGAAKRVGCDVGPGCPSSFDLAIRCHQATRPAWMNLTFGPDPWLNSTTMGTGISHAQARATKGALKFHGANQGQTSGGAANGADGHVGTSLGDGRSIEAIGHALDVRVWTFDDDETTYCALLPGMTGFDQTPAPNPDPSSPWEAHVMGIIAKAVPGAHVQTNGPRKGAMPLVGATNNADFSADIRGYNGATFRETDPSGKPVGNVLTTLHIGHLNKPIEDSDVVYVIDQSDPNHHLIPTHRILFIAGDGGSFGPYECSAVYA